MKPFKNIDEFKRFLKKCQEEHERLDLTNVSLQILEEKSKRRKGVDYDSKMD
jgi:hypothetical protein